MDEYEFSHWESMANHTINPSVHIAKGEIELTTKDTLIAVFNKIENSNKTELVINELMASNNTTASDQNDEFDDWIELYNNSDKSIDLTGYFLSDKSQNLIKYIFPDSTKIGSNDYLIIWADEDDEQPGLHANFKLSKNGENSIFSLAPIQW